MIDILIQRYDRKLLTYLGILAVMGTVMLYSASWYESFSSSNGRTEMLFLQGHLKRMLVGVFFLFGFLTLDYRRLKEVAPYFIIVSIFLLIITKGYYLVNGLGWSKPARWLFIGPFSIQTSDIARMAVIVYMAYYVDKKQIIVTMEKMALQLMMFSGDVTKYGLARAMSKADESENE